MRSLLNVQPCHPNYKTESKLLIKNNYFQLIIRIPLMSSCHYLDRYFVYLLNITHWDRITHYFFLRIKCMFSSIWCWKPYLDRLENWVVLSRMVARWMDQDVLRRQELAVRNQRKPSCHMELHKDQFSGSFCSTCTCLLLANSPGVQSGLS